MKRCWVSFIGVVLAFTSVCSVGWAGEKLRIANEAATPPFNFLDKSGQVAGFDVEITAALCKAMGVDYEIVIQDWDGMIPGLLANNFDAIISDMSITEKRKKAALFSDPYYEETGLFAAKKGKTFDFSEKGLAGKRIGVQRGTTFANYIKGVYGKNVRVEYYETPNSQTLDLKAGRLDLILASDVFINEWIGGKEGKDCRVVGKPVRDKRYLGEGVGVVVRKQDSELCRRFNEALAQIKADGTMMPFTAKYFGKK